MRVCFQSISTGREILFPGQLSFASEVRSRPRPIRRYSRRYRVPPYEIAPVYSHGIIYLVRSPLNRFDEADALFFQITRVRSGTAASEPPCSRSRRPSPTAEGPISPSRRGCDRDRPPHPSAPSSRMCLPRQISPPPCRPLRCRRAILAWFIEDLCPFAEMPTPAALQASFIESIDDGAHRAPASP